MKRNIARQLLVKCHVYFVLYFHVTLKAYFYHLKKDEI